MDEEVKISEENTVSEEEIKKPRLKKVKRPVRRIGAPGTTLPMSPRQDSNNFGSGSVDSYLDDTPSQKFDRNNPRFIDDSDVAPSKMPSLMVGNMFTMKGMAVVSLGVFLLGFIFAKMFFTQETIVADGLQGVVVNPEVPRGRARCGIAEKTQGCVLYMMNPQRQELNARDFYDLAAQLTGRQRFVIETGNMRYSSVRIRPGDIAQLNIPPLQ